MHNFEPESLRAKLEHALCLIVIRLFNARVGGRKQEK